MYIYICKGRIAFYFRTHFFNNKEMIAIIPLHYIIST